jgi:NitT/TauT family transport system substrate-binding protein
VIGHGLSRAGKGWFEERLGPGVELEWYVYNAGPTAMEALLAGSIELTYVGPNPALNAFIRSEGDEVRIVAGACSGGAALVVQPDGRIREAADFRGKRIGSPQLGNTQDVAARAFLKSKGLRITQTGGDALVLPTANPDQLTLFQKGDLDAVWTVEPWVTRLELEAGAELYLEEKALWPETGGRYVTTHLVSSVEFLAQEPALLERFVAAHVELTAWIAANPEEAKRLLNAEIEKETTKGLPREVLDRAWARIDITHDPVRASLERCARDAHAAGFLKEVPDLARIYALEVLNDVLARMGRPGVL